MSTTAKIRPRTGWLVGIAVVVTAASAIGCNTPTAPDISEIALQLINPLVMVDGQSVNGQSIQMGQMVGTSTFFQATLMSGAVPAPGLTVQAQYQVPHQGPGMMGTPGQGTMTLYDDGTHGDPTAGDGTYCFDDTQGQYGFHMANSPMGQYHYEFFGIGTNRQHSNHMTVNVTMVAAAPTVQSLQLSNAQVMVGTQVANGGTFQMGQMSGTSTYFRATLTGPAGPAPGESVRVQYQIPHHGPGMMSSPSEGIMYLYDDGTHGDPVAGDGIYCFDDHEGLYGFHMADTAMGQYHYVFFGVGHDEQHSNHMTVNVTMVSS